MHTTDYERIERAILYLAEHAREQPSLAQVSRRAGLSEYHFQRLFTRWAGVSPKRFLQFQTLAHAKRLLGESRTLLDATYDAGLSGAGRLHDLFVSIEAMTPGEYKAGGAGLRIVYGVHPSPFGECVLAATERGICGLAFSAPAGSDETVLETRGRWPRADWQLDSSTTGALAERIFGSSGGAVERRSDGGIQDGASEENALPAGAMQTGRRRVHAAGAPLRVLVRGTRFQLKVWEALLRVPEGLVVSYEDLAALAGESRAVRATAGAVARNPVAYLIPCHRVIRKVGDFGQYHWGAARKRAILTWEAARSGRLCAGAAAGDRDP